jgi:ketosteroid isomerase-like protein
MVAVKKQDFPRTDADTGILKSITRLYEAEARYSASGAAEDRSALLATLHPDIVLHQPESLPYGGTWRGREAFGQWLDAFVDAWTEVTPTDPQMHVCGDDLLVATVTMRARAHATGKAIDMPICQVIRFAEDLPVDWRNFAWDTAKMLDALGDTSQMQRACYSSVLDEPIDEAWKMIRDFNNYPRYIEGVTESVIENGKRGDEVGAVRRFRYDEAEIRQRLTAHSDADHSLTYAGMEPFPFPEQRGEAPPPVNYQGTMRLAPIVDGNRTYIEWFVEFDASAKHAPLWKELLSGLVAQWVDSLRRTLAGQP